MGKKGACHWFSSLSSEIRKERRKIREERRKGGRGWIEEGKRKLRKVEGQEKRR